MIYSVKKESKPLHKLSIGDLTNKGIINDISDSFIKMYFCGLNNKAYYRHELYSVSITIYDIFRSYDVTPRLAETIIENNLKNVESEKDFQFDNNSIAMPLNNDLKDQNILWTNAVNDFYVKFDSQIQYFSDKKMLSIELVKYLKANYTIQEKILPKEIKQPSIGYTIKPEYTFSIPAILSVVNKHETDFYAEDLKENKISFMHNSPVYTVLKQYQLLDLWFNKVEK